jgi:ribokinase
MACRRWPKAWLHWLRGTDMQKTIGLLAIGDPCLDVVIRTARTPAWDDKCVGSAAGLYGGGTEANVACAASRLGLASTVWGRIGDDNHGAVLLDGLAHFGVDCSLLRRQPGAASASAIVLLSPQGERAIVWVPMPADGADGARGMPSQLGLDAALARSRWAYTMPYDAEDLAALHAATQRAGTALAIDVEREGARSSGALQRMLQHCDMAFLNASGFSAAMGHAPSADGLRALYAGAAAHTIVVTLGAAGAIAIDRHGVAVQSAFPVAVVDATGAGDTFNAAFLVAHAQGQALAQALQFACAAASHSVVAMGARGGMPTLEQVRSRLERQ